MEYSRNMRTVAMWTILFILATVGTIQGCTFQDGVRYVGGDLKTVTAVSRESCGLLCLSTEGCSGYTFYPSSKNCALKFSFEKVESDVKALSGIVTGQCDFEDNYEFPLFTSLSGLYEGVPTKEECCRWCSQNVKCAGFTFFKSGTKKGNCELKYATSNRVPSPNMVSGVLSVKTCIFEEGVDFRGFDQKTVTNVTNKTDCCASCRSTTNCTAFSYVYSGAGMKTCVLKTNSVNRVSNVDAVSAVSKGVTCSQQSLSSKSVPKSSPPPRPRLL